MFVRRKNVLLLKILNWLKKLVTLTQNIDEQGNLVGVANMSTTETTLENSNEVVSGADIRLEYFKGDNIVTSSGNDNNDE